MPWLDLIWDYGPGGNVEHIAANGVSLEEVRDVMESEVSQRSASRRSGQPIVIGYTKHNRRLAVVYEEVGEFTFYPITSYDVE